HLRLVYSRQRRRHYGPGRRGTARDRASAPSSRRKFARPTQIRGLAASRSAHERAKKIRATRRAEAFPVLQTLEQVPPRPAAEPSVVARSRRALAVAPTPSRFLWRWHALRLVRRRRSLRRWRGRNSQHWRDRWHCFGWRRRCGNRLQQAQLLHRLARPKARSVLGED